MPKGQDNDDEDEEDDEDDEDGDDGADESVAFQDMGFDINVDMVDSTPVPFSPPRAVWYDSISPPRVPSPPHAYSHHSTHAPPPSVESHLERLEIEVRPMRKDQ